VFTTYLHSDKKNSISDNNATTILEDGNKNMWIATRMGLNKYNKKTNQFSVYTMVDGLPDNSIAGILEDGNKNLWLSTNHGIACFNPLTNKIKNYSKSDGLQANEFKQQASCKSSSGTMYFGGNNGFNQFTPERVKAVVFEPPLIITNFQVFNKEVTIANKNNPFSPLTKSITETKKITLPYSSSVFSFEFASLNYTPSDKKSYRYKLEGFDEDWNQVGNARMATYTHLNPGKYFFKVKGLNNEGQWSSNILSIEIIITPPFWLTWWFKILILIVLIAGILAIDHYRNKIIKTQKIKLQQQVNKQTEQLLLLAQDEHNARTAAESANINTEIANKELKMKNRELEQFAYVASHDLQEPLRTTAGFVDLLQKQYKGKLDDKADKYLAFIADASTRMRVLIKDLLEFSRIGTKAELKTVDCNIILKNMLSDIDAAIQETNASVQFGEMPVLMGYPTEIKLLFQNLVVNAIKFRKKDTAPQINITVEQKKGFWQFAVNDNGIGMEKEHNERIFDIFQRLHTRIEYEGSGIGLSHCKKIVELHHGKIWVISNPGVGSTFYFTMPISDGTQIKTTKKQQS
jgi:signal transduction histidine kinase